VQKFNRDPNRHRLRLYVAGTTPGSMRAVQSIKQICEAELAGHYDLEVIDVYKEPGRAMADQIVAIPTLIKQAPGVVKRLIGDLSQKSKVLMGLGVATAR
jgi:circadian clock protein KaiB